MVVDSGQIGHGKVMFAVVQVVDCEGAYGCRIDQVYLGGFEIFGLVYDGTTELAADDVS